MRHRFSMHLLLAGAVLCIATWSKPSAAAPPTHGSPYEAVTASQIARGIVRAHLTTNGRFSKNSKHLNKLMVRIKKASQSKHLPNGVRKKLSSKLLIDEVLSVVKSVHKNPTDAAELNAFSAHLTKGLLVKLLAADGFKKVDVFDKIDGGFTVEAVPHHSWTLASELPFTSSGQWGMRKKVTVKDIGIPPHKDAPPVEGNVVLYSIERPHGTFKTARNKPPSHATFRLSDSLARAWGLPTGKLHTAKSTLEKSEREAYPEFFHVTHETPYLDISIRANAHTPTRMGAFQHVGKTEAVPAQRDRFTQPAPQQ